MGRPVQRSFRCSCSKLQKLTRKAKGIAKAVQDFKNGVNTMNTPLASAFYTTGHIACCCPVVKIRTGPEPLEREIIFQHPYRGAPQLYLDAEQSQVGMQTETLFRLDARKSKEYPNVKAPGSLWKTKVAGVCEQIRQVLAPGARKVNANLYKLLIYSRNDFFNRHQDAQHSTRMFATLLFFLPVAYSGGEFELYKKDTGGKIVVEDKKTVDGCTWVAFYTDVYHGVSEVKSGFRVVLNYFLTFEGNMSPSFVFPKFDQPLKRKIRRYIRSSSKTLLAFPMSYKYTLATLFPAFLKGVDAHIFNALTDVGTPELCFVLEFHKTKVIEEKDKERDHTAKFQGVFVVQHEIAQKYLDINNKYEEEVTKMEQRYKKSRQINEQMTEVNRLTKERDEKFIELKDDVMLSQGDQEFEWIVPRDDSGEPEVPEAAFNFEFLEGELGWLGNMSPPKEYYYLYAAIVVRGERKVE